MVIEILGGKGEKLINNQKNFKNSMNIWNNNT